MSKIRVVFLLLLLLGGALVIYALYKSKSQVPLGSSFSPVFQLLGKSTSSVDIALTRILPINEMDERAYGDAIAESYEFMTDSEDASHIYLNLLIQDLAAFSKKKFNYRVFVISSSTPNAFALPGGVICVTDGLLSTMKSEAQIISVLSHEMGHIERGHCFDAIKYELAFKKINAPSIGQLADFTINLFLRHSFSKTQENSADEYGYDLVLLTKYDPMAVSDAFRELQKTDNSPRWQSGNIVSAYLETHPPLPSRIEKYNQWAMEWWLGHNSIDGRYIGNKNLNVRIPLSQQAFPNEWTNRPHED
jgi:beta-barrel assembly-enhancing protease